MNKKNLILGLFSMLLLGAMSLSPNLSQGAPTAEEQEVTVCPGKGERCAKVAGIFWKKKTPGGPGIIIE